MLIHTIPSTAETGLNDNRGGINVRLGPVPSGMSTLASPVWTIAGWQLQYVRMAANARLSVNADKGQVFVKVITGALQQPTRTAYPPPFAVRSTLVETDAVVAGTAGALIAIHIKSPAAPARLQRMDEIQFDGPNAQALTFRSFHEKFGAATDLFKGADAHMTPGIHLLDDQGEEITNLIYWTAGKGVGLSTHNHGRAPSAAAPAFAEVHWVFSNGTGNGGMYLCDDPEAAPKQRFPMQTGDEHGPFFHVRGRHPQMKDNGAVDYPWHGWAGGTDDQPGQAYDLVCAFEISPKYALLDA